MAQSCRRSIAFSWWHLLHNSEGEYLDAVIDVLAASQATRRALEIAKDSAVERDGVQPALDPLHCPVGNNVAAAVGRPLEP